MTNPYPEGTGEHLLYAIFGEQPQESTCGYGSCDLAEGSCPACQGAV